MTIIDFAGKQQERRKRGTVDLHSEGRRTEGRDLSNHKNGIVLEGCDEHFFPISQENMRTTEGLEQVRGTNLAREFADLTASQTVILAFP